MNPPMPRRPRHVTTLCALCALTLGAGALLARPRAALAQEASPSQTADAKTADAQTDNAQTDNAQTDNAQTDNAKKTDDASDEDQEDWEAMLEQGPGDKRALRIDAVQIQATPEELARQGGSAQRIDAKQLELYEHDDPHSVLQQVPGVYLRHEDGMGLRPNIGIRGGNSERSKKVTLMEDGVLFGPAPYAAPAAYYFPLMTRMVGVEVYKGPSAVLFGPQTIGGAINLLSRPVPLMRSQGQLDLALGAFPTQGRGPTGKIHGHYGFGMKHGGALVEVVQLGSPGFKDLDGGGDTGFSRTELTLRGRLHTDLSAPVMHALDLKLGYAQELSQESYVGLSDADFAASPNRRYAGTQLDTMDWSRLQAQLSYVFELGERFSLTATAYNHTLERTWRRLGGFAEGTPIERVLADPSSPRNRLLYDLVRGQEDTSDPLEALVVISNQRAFLSQGLQLRALHTLQGQSWSNKLEVGARLHRDWIDRLHTAERFAMRQGRMARVEGDVTTVTTDNKGQAQALALYAQDTLRVLGLTVSPGLRLEAIQTQLDDRAGSGAAQATNSDVVLIPGMGAHYALTDAFGVLVGVHRGFSPVSPGQDDAARPETSLNYEAGARLYVPSTGTLIETIGFFTDYSNLLGECTFAAGCTDAQLDLQFNAGKVRVYGVEALAQHQLALGAGLSAPVRAAYTLTLSEFQGAFRSENPQFADVQRGDELPYVPRHQLMVGGGVQGERWAVDATLTHTSAMRERAGQGELDPKTSTQAYTMLDLAAQYRFAHAWMAYLRIDNLLNAQPQVARFPQGARPSRPLLAQLGLKIDL